MSSQSTTKKKTYTRKNKRAKIHDKKKYQYKNVLQREIKCSDIASKSKRGNKLAICHPHLDKSIRPPEIAFFVTLVGNKPDGTALDPKKYHKVLEKECQTRVSSFC